MKKKFKKSLFRLVLMLTMMGAMVYFSACSDDGDPGGTLSVTITFPDVSGMATMIDPAEVGDVLEVWIWESLEAMEATATGNRYLEDPDQIKTVTLTQDHINNGLTVSFELTDDICYAGVFVPTHDPRWSGKFETGDLCEIYNDVEYHTCWENANPIAVPGNITIALDNRYSS